MGRTQAHALQRAVHEFGCGVYESRGMLGCNVVLRGSATGQLTPCPFVAAQAAEAARKAEAATVTPLAAPLRRVSFSDAPAAVRLVPGSSEARGVDLERALTGRMPFTRRALLVGQGQRWQDC